LDSSADTPEKLREQFDGLKTVIDDIGGDAYTKIDNLRIGFE